MNEFGSSMNPMTLSLERYIKRSFNYLTRMVDDDHLPYFHVFATTPAQAAHDFPDFGDVMVRQLQGATMGRVMTGEELPIERIWLEKALSMVDPESGLFVQPESVFSEQKVVTLPVQGLVIYALLTVGQYDRNTEIFQIVRRMIDHLSPMVAQSKTEESAWAGFAIKSLMTAGRVLEHSLSFDLAKELVSHVFTVANIFTPENTFQPGGHMHANCRILSGAIDYALYADDAELHERIDALYRYIRSQTTRFGFLPEVIGRTGDIISCETCAIMDYLVLAVTLANHGHPEYWGDVERMMRNHLIESQVKDGSWLTSDFNRSDTEQFTWRDIGSRMVGGFAGWSSPNHILAAGETINAHWGGPKLRDKPRAFQNCCGGSGIHAFFLVWKNAARFEQNCLHIHLHIDKLLPQAEIRCYQPYQGVLQIRLKRPCRVRVRIPDFVKGKNIQVSCNGNTVKTTSCGYYLEIPEHPSGSCLNVRYPLPILEEEVSVGNPGRRQYSYRVTWKGDTVVALEPTGENSPTGYSEYEKKEITVFYGQTGPCSLYQRDHFLKNDTPRNSTIHIDNGALDYWCFQ